uniref:ADP-ribosylation factor-like protein 2 (Trinotate prediction) n=1 Tax=Henneguya salminicola TaxID=69463 RepID=A0A6G3MJW3_HENSL
MGAIFSRKSERRVLVLGLDNAGKTSNIKFLNSALVTLFKEKEPPTKTVPTVGFDVKTFNTSKFKVNAWDVGGQDSIQHLWHHYFENTNALLYLVDSTDTVRLENSAASLKDSLSYPELRATPVLILCNKVDIEGGRLVF